MCGACRTDQIVNTVVRTLIGIYKLGQIIQKYLTFVLELESQIGSNQVSQFFLITFLKYQKISNNAIVWSYEAAAHERVTIRRENNFLYILAFINKTNEKKFNRYLFL